MTVLLLHDALARNRIGELLIGSNGICVAREVHHHFDRVARALSPEPKNVAFGTKINEVARSQRQRGATSVKKPAHEMPHRTVIELLGLHAVPIGIGRKQ